MVRSVSVAQQPKCEPRNSESENTYYRLKKNKKKNPACYKQVQLHLVGFQLKWDNQLTVIVDTYEKRSFSQFHKPERLIPLIRQWNQSEEGEPL